MNADQIRIAQLKAELAAIKGQSKTKAPKAAKEITTLKAWYAIASKSINEQSAAFLVRTRSFLINGEHASIAKPIINQYDYGQLTAHACIESLFQSLIAWESNKLLGIAIKDMEEGKHRGNWLVTVWGDCRPTAIDGSVQIEKSFNTYKEAAGWADRRLVETYSDAYAILTAQTEATVIKVDRHDALYRLRELPSKTVCKITGKTTSSLSWGQKKSGGDRAYFSRG